MNHHGIRICLRSATALVAALCASVAVAQETAAPGSTEQANQDPGIVITRVVMPRTAYRGVPTEDNPIHARATTFPSRMFLTTMDATLGNLLGDGELAAATGSTGIIPQATQTLTDLLGTAEGPVGRSAIGLSGVPQSQATGAPLGMGATSSAGAAISGVTGGLANQITGALHTALQGTQP